MQRSIDRVSTLFTLTIVGLCVASMASLLFVLYAVTTNAPDETTSSDQLHSLTTGYPAVAEYLEQEKDSEAHFVTLANLVKEDQQSLLTRSALLAALPVLIASAILGWFLARFLLRPVSEAYASQTRFMQDAAHELRNPLAIMSAVIQQAKHDDSKVATISRLDTLERQTNHLVRINEDLLFLEHRNQAPPTYIDVNELLHDVIETMQPLANEKLVTLRYSGHRAKLAIYPDDFVCLVRNLVENAIKYSTGSKRAKVNVSLKQLGKSTVLTVKDFGIGIPKQDVPHIGKRFYRASNVARRDGSGLGFAIIRKIVNDYKADISIDSTLNKGTTIAITFRN